MDFPMMCAHGWCLTMPNAFIGSSKNWSMGSFLFVRCFVDWGPGHGHSGVLSFAPILLAKWLLPRVQPSARSIMVSSST